MKRIVVLAIALLLVAATGLVAVRNTARVELDLMVVRPEAPIIIWLLVALVSGVILTVCCLLPGFWRRRSERRRLQRELRDARDECDRLRRAPLRDR
jgi:uncharacterized integral membrane protein